MNLNEALNEYHEQIKEVIERAQKCKCEHVREVVMKMLGNPWLKVKGDDYGLIQLWCTECDDGLTFHKPYIDVDEKEYNVK